jgi:Flp pilus assembly protein TadB
MKHWLADRDEAARIPDRAALLVLVGSVAAVIGFVAALFWDSGFATLILTAGLVVAAIGMRKAERAIEGLPDALDLTSTHA